MKPVAAFFLACLMLVGSFVPQNDLSELAKLPQLLEHYRFHRSAAGGGLSLAEFLAEHYGSGTKQHFGCTFSARHRHDHEGLPLHGRHTSGGGTFVPVAARPALPPRGGVRLRPGRVAAGRRQPVPGPGRGRPAPAPPSVARLGPRARRARAGPPFCASCPRRLIGLACQSAGGNGSSIPRFLAPLSRSSSARAMAQAGAHQGRGPRPLAAARPAGAL